MLFDSVACPYRVLYWQREIDEHQSSFPGYPRLSACTHSVGFIGTSETCKSNQQRRYRNPCCPGGSHKESPRSNHNVSASTTSRRRLFPSLLEPQNPKSPPNAAQYIDDTFSQTMEADVDTMLVVPRASTHYEFDFLAYPSSLQASRYGERVAFYYTLAWFDRYLHDDVERDGHTGTQRLTAEYFDGSADASSIGAGTFDAASAAADPTNPAAGNVPYKIDGKCVSNLLSFYYQSAYWLNGGKVQHAHTENPLGCSS